MGRFLRAVEGISQCRTAAVVVMLLAGILIAGGWGDRADAALTDLQVQASTREAVQFSLTGLQASWQAKSLREGTLSLFDVSLTGFITSGPIGGPRVPVLSGWLVVPPGTRPEARIVSEQWQEAGGRALMVEMTPTSWRSPDGSDSGVSEILVLPGETIAEHHNVPSSALASLAKRGGPMPTAALSLGEVSWWRGHRVVPYQLTGVLANSQGQATQVLSGGRWEVRFVPDKAFTAAGIPAKQSRRTSTRNDDNFGAAFLNANLLAELSTEAAYHGVAQPAQSKAILVQGNKAGTLLGEEARLTVARTTMQRVTYSRLRSRNLLPDVPIQESQLRLYQRRYLTGLDDGSGSAPYIEIEVPIHVFGEGDLFDGDDFFVFYGLRLRDDVSYSADFGEGVVAIPSAGDPHEQNNYANIYWLAASEPDVGSPWARMNSTSLPAAAGTPLTNYRRNDHVEEQESFREKPPGMGARETFPPVAADRLYFNHFSSKDASAPINPLYSPDPNGTDVDLKVAITGFSYVAHSLLFYLVTGENSTLLEPYTLSSNQEVVRSYTVPAAAIDGPSTRVRMTANPEGRVTFTYLNWVKISYDALYQASFNRLEFHGGTGVGARPMEVTGFSNDDLGLFEITDPRHPVYIPLAPENVVADGGTWKLSVMPDQPSGQQREFYVAADASDTGIMEFNVVNSTVAEGPSVPTDTGGQNPGLIVVTHAEFADAIGRWVDHRIARSGGQLNVHVVDVQDIYDWYSGGLKDAWAIKRFTNHAISVWGSWSLMIVGDANENTLSKELAGDSADWSTDWVPTHYHVQDAGSQYNPELMASDKWYTALSAGADYPNDPFPYDVSAPWDMYCGRFPCNNVSELNNMIDKVIAVENLQPGQAWRRRGIFFADDEWSNGLGATALTELRHNPYTDGTFGKSERDSLGAIWGGRSAVALDSVVVLLKPYMDEGFPDPNGLYLNRPLDDARDWAAANATGPLLGFLSAGGLVCHYQGHANPYVLSSEHWLEDRRETQGRDDVDLLANVGKPWFFMGMGCHIADWAQNAVTFSVTPNERSISEKMLIRANAGASAVYASSGFEYISNNRVFGEYIFRRWISHPPAGPSSSVAGNSGRSRWMTGELMWAAEADIMSSPNVDYTSNYRDLYQEMNAQYVILGDPLMMLDGGEPEVTATLVGSPNQEISGEIDLLAIDASNQRTINLVARDEAGIDRIRVIDSAGNDLTSQSVVSETLPPGATSHAVVDYELGLAVRPYDHSLTVQVFDTAGALPSDRRYELVLNMPQTAVFIADGVELDPDSWLFQSGVPVEFNSRVTSSAQLNAGMVMSLTSETLTISEGVSFTIVNDRELDIVFTAEAATTDDEQTHEVILTIDGLATTMVIQSGVGEPIAAGIGRVLNFPNPMHDTTSFVFESGTNPGPGTIKVFSVGGSTVARIEFRYSGGGTATVPWDGRDSRGDELGNGTYLYRIEIESAQGTVVSQMQRLVVMR